MNELDEYYDRLNEILCECEDKPWTNEMSLDILTRIRQLRDELVTEPYHHK